MTGVREWAMERKESVGGKKTSEGEERIRREKIRRRTGEVKKETGEQRKKIRNWRGRTGPPNVVQEVLPDLRII